MPYPALACVAYATTQPKLAYHGLQVAVVAPQVRLYDNVRSQPDCMHAEVPKRPNAVWSEWDDKPSLEALVLQCGRCQAGTNAIT